MITKCDEHDVFKSSCLTCQIAKENCEQFEHMNDEDFCDKKLNPDNYPAELSDIYD